MTGSEAGNGQFPLPGSVRVRVMVWVRGKCLSLTLTEAGLSLHVDSGLDFVFKLFVYTVQ